MPFMSYDGLIVSPSGYRGIWEKGLNQAMAKKAAKAFARYVGGGEVIVGRDTRHSGPALVQAVIAGLYEGGAKIIDVGIAPTPAIIWKARVSGLNGGVVVSGSHNEPEWNGLKFFLRGGNWPTEKEVDEQYALYLTERDDGNYDAPTHETEDIIDEYVDFIISNLTSAEIERNRPRVVIDAAGGAGSRVTPRLLRALGAEVFVINGDEGVFNRKMEPTPDALSRLSDAVKEKNALVGFAHDCDADRLTLVDEKGQAQSPNMTLAVIADQELKKADKNKILVTNVASSALFKDIADRNNGKLVLSKVGEGHVVRKMLEVNAQIGGEGSSGGVIQPKLNLTRDGVLAAATITSYIGRGISLESLISSFPVYYLIRDKINGRADIGKDMIEAVKSAYPDGQVDTIDGVRVSWERAWGLVRPSRTEPVTWITAEARTQVGAQHLFKELVALTKKYADFGNNKRFFQRLKRLKE